MDDAKKSSDWDMFEKRQQRNDRDSHRRSMNWFKAITVIAFGLGLGFVAYLVLR